MKQFIHTHGLSGRIARYVLGIVFLLTLRAAGDDMADFSKAVLEDNAQRARELLDKNPDLLNGDEKTGSPLCAATFLYRIEVIKLLISKGADVHKTAHQNSVPKGADDGMPKDLRVTPLHLAAYQGYADVAKMLLDAKADPMAKSEDGTTPLHTAAAYDRTDVVKVLIAAKADLNVRDMDEATPLHYAAAAGRPEIYALLVAAGADVDVVAQKGGYAGKTPQQMAKENFEAVRPDPALTKVLNSMRFLGLALHEFAANHESFPNEATAKALEKTFRGSVKTNPSSADDFLNQVALVYSEPASLKNTCMTGDGIDKRWICSYVIGASPASNPKRPVALLPLIHGKPLFDAAALSGKAVVMHADNSVRHFPIEPDGRVLIDGLDIFDPKQPFWENSKPDIKWPQQQRK